MNTLALLNFGESLLIGFCGIVYMLVLLGKWAVKEPQKSAQSASFLWRLISKR